MSNKKEQISQIKIQRSPDSVGFLHQEQDKNKYESINFAAITIFKNNERTYLLSYTD